MMSAGFRTRAAARDAQTTATRLETVRRAITMAMRETARELAGLEHRLADAYITGVVGTEEARVEQRSGGTATLAPPDSRVEARRANDRSIALRAEAAEYAALLKALPGNSR